MAYNVVQVTGPSVYPQVESLAVGRYTEFMQQDDYFAAGEFGGNLQQVRNTSGVIQVWDENEFPLQVPLEGAGVLLALLAVGGYFAYKELTDDD